MTVEIRNAAGNVIKRGSVQDAIEYGKQFSYVVLRAKGPDVEVRYGTGEMPDTCVIHFSSYMLASEWVNNRVRKTAHQVKGQFILHARWLQMEAAAKRARD